MQIMYEHIKFFENLLTFEDKSQTPINEASQEEISSMVVEQFYESCKRQRVRIIKDLGFDEIDFQSISFCLLEGNGEKVIRKILISLQIENDFNILDKLCLLEILLFGKTQ